MTVNKPSDAFGACFINLFGKMIYLDRKSTFSEHPIKPEMNVCVPLNYVDCVSTMVYLFLQPPIAQSATRIYITDDLKAN